MTTSTTTTTDTQADRALKAKHRAMWALGDYPAIAAVIPELGPELVAANGVRAGDRVLDGGAGTGNAAVRSGNQPCGPLPLLAVTSNFSVL